MTTLLRVDSTGKGSHSVTKPLTEYFATVWASKTKGLVIVRDLLESNVPVVNQDFVGAMFTPADQLSAGQAEVLKTSDKLVQELEQADVYVFGVPMYNFSVPGVFKLYIDQIVRVGKTFAFGETGGIGLLKNKTLIVVTASGGDYSVEPMRSMDFVQPYLKAIFGFLGVADIRFISVPGRVPEVIAKNSEIAKKQIDEIVDSLLPVAR